MEKTAFLTSDLNKMAFKWSFKWIFKVGFVEKYGLNELQTQMNQLILLVFIGQNLSYWQIAFTRNAVMN